MGFRLQIMLCALLFLLILAGCNGKKKQQCGAEANEDMRAKELLQGIWVNEDDIVFKVQGDSIYYPDSTSIPVRFKIVRDTLILQGTTSVKYLISKQSEHLFVFKNQYGDVVRLVKSNNPDDQYVFEKQRPVSFNQRSLIKRDTVIIYRQERYHSYIQVNPTTYKIIKNTYTDVGVEVGNIYYDNIVHVSLFHRADKLFSRNFRKEDFKKFIPEQFYVQCILSDIIFDRPSDRGFFYTAILPIPDSTTSYLIRIFVSFEGQYELSI